MIREMLSEIAGGVVSTARTVAGVALAPLWSLPRLAVALERIADSRETLERIAAATGIPTLQQSVEELNRRVADLNSNLSPVQDTAERVGDLVERIPGTRRRRDTD